MRGEVDVELAAAGKGDNADPVDELGYLHEGEPPDAGSRRVAGDEFVQSVEALMEEAGELGGVQVL